MEAVVRPCESHSVPFRTYILTRKCVFVNEPLVWFKDSDFCTLTGTTLGYPVIAMCHGGSCSFGSAGPATLYAPEVNK